MSALFWLSETQWAAIEPHLSNNQPGAQRVDDLVCEDVPCPGSALEKRWSRARPDPTACRMRRPA